MNKLCEPLTCDKRSVRSWISRLDEALRLIKNIQNRDKVSHLIANIGDEGYQHLRSLTAPEDPNQKSYDELKKLLIDHLDPTPNPLGERFKFFRMCQGQANIQEWKSKLQYAAAFCDFGDYAAKAVTDQFIFGLACERTRESLLELETVTLKTAVKKAMLKEQSKRENQMYTQENRENKENKSAAVNKIRPMRGGASASGGQRSTQKSAAAAGGSKNSSHGGKRKSLTGTSMSCKRCKLLLKSNKCTDKICKTKCFNCNLIGHTIANCRKRTEKINQLNESDDYDCSPDHDFDDSYFISVCKFETDCKSKPIVKLTINDERVGFELDTGSAITCISKSLHSKYFSEHTRLKPAGTTIKVANGTTVSNVSVCKVKLKLRDNKYQIVQLHVVDDPFPSLLGRDWISLIWGNDWLDRLTGQCSKLQGADAEIRAADARDQGVEIRATLQEGLSPGQVLDTGEYELRFRDFNCMCNERGKTEPERVNVATEKLTGTEPSYLSANITCDQVGTVVQGSDSQNRGNCKLIQDLPQTDTFIVGRQDDLQTRLDRIQQSKIFNPGVGEVIGYEATLQLKEEHTPVFKKARPVPFAMKEKIEQTLEQMEKDGILQQVDNSSYASPIVPVVKPDGTVRICGDYKATLNPNLETKQYPLPTVEDCFAPMAGGEKFTRLDIRQAYNNIMLRSEDQKLTTINTSKGLYVWKRLPYGVSSSTAIFQQTIDRVLQGLKGVACRVDDVIITGKNDEEHLDTLEEVVRRLERANFRCNKNKTKFLADEVTYLGYKIDKVGIRPCQSKVETLLRAKYPENLKSLEAFLGGAMYYARFIEGMSTICEPLNRLRRADVKWRFEKEEEKAFNKLKEALASSAVLTPYNPNLEVKIDTDSSKTGLGAVISHIMPDGSERPIEFASRTLNSAERNYSQIEKEALSLVWGVKRFHKFVYGRKFKLVSDHKPLFYILKEDKSIPEMGASRIVRWAITLASYQYEIQWRPTQKHSNADLCSRFPVESDAEDDWEADQVSEVFHNTFSDKPVINYKSISRFTDQDSILSKVRRFILEGWDERYVTGKDEFRPYYSRRDELSVEKGCILWGARVIVPAKLRQDVLGLLHCTHQGIVAVKAVARSFVWGPKMNDDIERVTRECSACQDSRNKPPKSTPHPWTPTKRPWQRIHADFCGPVNNNNYLIIVDAHTKWIEVINMREKTTSPATIKELEKVFARWGNPEMFVSDNGPQLVSTEMRQFLESQGIQQVPVPTYSPNSNGICERAVQSFKTAMRKASQQSTDFDSNLTRWLLHYRNTPQTTTQETPATMMLGRSTRTLLSLLDPLTRKQKSDLTVDKRKLRRFDIGSKVRVLEVRSGRWYKGIITGKESCKVYIVETKKGTERRHLDHLMLATDNFDMDLSREDETADDSCTEQDQTLHNPVVNEHKQAEPEHHTIPQQAQVPKSSAPVLKAKHPVIAIKRAKYDKSNVPSREETVPNDVRRSSRLMSKLNSKT